MLRAAILLLLGLLAAPLAAQTAPAPGPALGLKRLETGDDGRGWEGVGRLDISGRGFCTGALIAPDLVLTAAHCLFDRISGARIDPAEIEFLAGWRNGRAEAYRRIRRAVTHPAYTFRSEQSADRVRHDLALLELQQPIRTTAVKPFLTDPRPLSGDPVSVVSYARERAEAPSLERLCKVRARQQGVLVMSCEVDFGSSGAPVFSFASGEPRIVSVVSAMARLGGEPVSLGTDLQEPLMLLRAELAAGGGFANPAGPAPDPIPADAARRQIGAKFVRP